MKRSQKHFFLSVIGKDSSGIIAEITGHLSKCRCNLEDMVMTLLDGEFCMMMAVSVPNQQVIKKIQDSLHRIEKKRSLSINWYEVNRTLKRGKIKNQGSKNYLLNAIGADQCGIVAKISAYFSKNKINITDLNSKIIGSGKKLLYALMLEFDLPGHVTITKLKKDMEKLGKAINVDICVNTVESLEL